jgi:hypothetical protein
MTCQGGKLNTIIVRRLYEGRAWYAQMPSRGPLHEAAIANHCYSGLVPTPFADTVDSEVVREHVQRTYPNAVVEVYFNGV